MRKKVDSRIKAMVEENVGRRHRSMFVMVGDRSRDQIVNLHYLLTRVASTSATPILSSYKQTAPSKDPTASTPTTTSVATSKPSVLWCYQKELGFTSHRRKRAKQTNKKIKQGSYDPNLDDPFELFISSTPIRYCYYKESQSVLGQTFGMCVLQDFEGITPDILCRTIETVSGGGIICVLLRSMSSLKQLYALTMETHSRYRTTKQPIELFQPRFNERFILSLADCSSCLVVDDELNVLPISAHNFSAIQKVASPKAIDSPPPPSGEPQAADPPPPATQQAATESSVGETLCGVCVSDDQKRAVRIISECVTEKSLRQTVALTAGRGRGKSAALGLSIASAIAGSYSNIFVTAPLPENVATLFEFVQKGLQALGLKEHADFELVLSETTQDNSKYNTGISRHVVRINVFKNHRQCIQYISPEESPASLGQAELLVVDEAAAIPLPVVKGLLGPYLVLLSSTINGYEGTGRSLSLKLIHDIRVSATAATAAATTGGHHVKVLHRTLREISLEEPIRYGPGDSVEGWLHRLLCLDATVPAPLVPHGALATPAKCGLYLVNRTALFSYHKSSEEFLHKLMSLFVSSHYKNSPNDLLLLADAPAHYVFVLLPPIDADTDTLPDVYCAIQVSVEGALSKDVIKQSLGRGLRPSGDLIPWTMSQHFIDEDFGLLTGARVVRIATHPSLQRMGYGGESMKQLIEYFEGKGVSIDEGEIASREAELNGRSESPKKKRKREGKDALESSHAMGALQTEVLSCRSDLPPLLTACSDTKPSHNVDYIGACFGLTFDLFKFWNRRGFLPVYVRHTRNDITGEHSAIMLREIKNEGNLSMDSNWLRLFTNDFRARMVNLLGSAFDHMSTPLALSLLDPPTTPKGTEASVIRKLPSGLPAISHSTLCQFLTRHDIERLTKYSKQLADESLITDLLPPLCCLLFNGRLVGLTLSFLQCAVLLAVGCQRRSPSAVAAEFKIPMNQAMALFNKAIHKLTSYIQKLLEKDVIESTGGENMNVKPVESGQTVVPGARMPIKTFAAEQEDGAAVVRKALREESNLHNIAASPAVELSTARRH
eukprot:GHVS01099302.1.p1 GENE.GHVS01099302.1~~GHVS01099302.1.p1  ORF type:complete len:1062 (-),score=157.68 GHVS01099302.1:171-3356(-)